MRLTVTAARKLLLRENEKKFGDLLKGLRVSIYVPDQLDFAFQQYVHRNTKVFAEAFLAVYLAQVARSVSIREADLQFVGKFYVTKALEMGLPASLPSIDGIGEAMLSKGLPSGWTLSQRIWDLGNYGSDIEQIIRNGLQNKLGAEAIARQLDGFLLPNRHVETLTPYGRSLNFDSMRLARTEVMAAFREADKVALAKSPWITGLTWRLSSAHKDLCACDDLEGQTFASEIDVPDAPHPQCGCYLVPELMPAEDWVSALNKYFEDGTDNLGIADWLNMD